MQEPIIPPKESRRKRIRPSHGMWTLVSQDLGWLIRNELIHSRERDDLKHKNHVPLYTIPIMISYLRALSIEIENQKERHGRDEYRSKLLVNLENNPSSEILMICGHYKVKKEIKNNAELLNHVRNEIIHPSPYPEKGYNLPLYLGKLDKINVLWRPPADAFACNILDFFCSHNLMKWAANNLVEIAKYIIGSDVKYKHLNETRLNLIEEIKKNAV